jgi:aminomethyltransferase
MTATKTKLYDIHKKLGGKMVEFAGYWMPVQYAGIVQEHKCVRASVGMFDVSHMGEFFISGEAAEDYLQKMMINDVSKLEPGRAQYTAMCYRDGGLIDDLILYKFENRYMAIVNAANRQKDYDWLQRHLIDGVTLTDLSDELSLFAVQGRNAENTLQKLTDVRLPDMKFYHFAEGKLAGVNATIARTGYTGEDGFEVVVDNAFAVPVWQAIVASGAESGLKPIGLGARDTLRIEMKYCLYGNDIDATTNAIEAGLGWITKLYKGDFIGRDALNAFKMTGATRKLIGFVMKQKAVPRHGYTVTKDNRPVGRVTSGTFSPSLEKGIGMAYVDTPYCETGSEITVSVRGHSLAAEVVKTPFYQRDY